MKPLSRLPRKRGRIEIIPLIDIMFFLLAAFMVVSINKIKIDSLKISLPTEIPSTVHETKEDFVSVSLDADGQVQIDKELIASKPQLIQRLQEMYAANHDQKILISADREARHGDIMAVLGRIRQAGFQKVAFAIKSFGTPGAPAAPDTSGTDAAPDTSPGAAPATPAPADSPASPPPGH